MNIKALNQVTLKHSPIALPRAHVLSPIAPQFPLLLLEYYRTISLSLASFFAIPP